ncbi:tetratricopeptide repeat protein [Lichenicoccus sp.]|uniref:tetratricopeptide repeat protein n=1 Tax=Lichenicoccus sp. TaxID=2781899 RepID=UPI003D149CD7
MPFNHRAILALGLLLLLPAAAVAGPIATPSPGTLFGTYLSGIVAGAIGDTDIASDRLLDVLNADPGASGVRAQAFVFSALAGNPQAAALAAKVTGNPLSPLVLGNAAARAGDWAAARHQYQEIAGSPLNALLRPLLVAWAEQGAGDTDGALATLAPLAGDSPVAGLYAASAAMIADQAERVDQAGRLYQRAQTFAPGSDLIFVQSYASFLYRAGQPAQAKALVQALVQALPALSIAEPGLASALRKIPVATPLEGLARAYFDVASLIQQQGSRGRDAELFMLRFALDLAPDLTPARLLLADLQNQGGAPREALATLRQVPKDDPLYPVAALRVAVIGGAGGETAAAQATLEGLAARYPTRAEPLQALGNLLQDHGHDADAIKAYDRAIRLMSPLDAQDWQVLFARATAYDRLRQWPKAQSDLQHALQLDPNEPFLLNYLGYSWLERKEDLGRARTMIERALDEKPDDGSIRDSLGWAMYRQDDITGAVRELEHAAEQMPEDPTVNYHLGAAYWAAGRKIEARDQWRWALQLHPGKQDAARIATALRTSMLPGGDPVRAADKLPLPAP